MQTVYDIIGDPEPTIGRQIAMSFGEDRWKYLTSVAGLAVPFEPDQHPDIPIHLYVWNNHVYGAGPFNGSRKGNSIHGLSTTFFLENGMGLEAHDYNTSARIRKSFEELVVSIEYIVWFDQPFYTFSLNAIVYTKDRNEIYELNMRTDTYNAFLFDQVVNTESEEYSDSMAKFAAQTNLYSNDLAQRATNLLAFASS